MRPLHETKITKKHRHSRIETVIPECFYRESTDFAAFKIAGSPIEAFGDDEKRFMQRSRYIRKKFQTECYQIAHRNKS